MNEVLFNSAKRATGVTIQARGTTDGQNVQTIGANAEIVLTAGYLHTPQILQRSGVGPASLLQRANIPVVVDLPGVGSNFQVWSTAHPASSPSLTLEFSGPRFSLGQLALYVASGYAKRLCLTVGSVGTDANPNPSSIYSNTTFMQWADQLWAANRTGAPCFNVLSCTFAKNT